MKVTSFEDVKAEGFDICLIDNGCDGEADVIILDINSIFDYEERKYEACKDVYTSVAIIDDPSDYVAFENFGITSWINRDNIVQLPELLNEIKKRLES